MHIPKYRIKKRQLMSRIFIARNQEKKSNYIQRSRKKEEKIKTEIIRLDNTSNREDQ